MPNSSSNTPSKELRELIQQALVTVEYDYRAAHAEVLGKIEELLKQEYQRGRDDERKRLTTIYDNYINYLKGDKDGQ